MPEAGDGVDVSARRILLTGAGGFIGAHLARRLAGLGAEVHAVYRRATPPVDPVGVTWHRCDLAEPDPTAALVGRVRPDAIVHLASEVSGRRDVRMVAPMLRSNLLGSVNLLTAAATEVPGARVVLAGSIEEPEPDGAPCSPYAAAKHASTGYGRMFHELCGLDVTTLRVAMVYGPAQADRTKLVPYVITSLLRGEAPSLSSGHREIDWVYVDDVVDAFVAAVGASGAGGEVLEIGSGTRVSIRETVDRLAELAGDGLLPRYGAVPDRPLDAARIADPTAAGKAIGWWPSTPLEDGLRRTVQWYRDHPA